MLRITFKGEVHFVFKFKEKLFKDYGAAEADGGVFKGFMDWHVLDQLFDCFSLLILDNNFDIKS